MEQKIKQEVLNSLNANTPAKWVLFEIQNLKRMVKDPSKLGITQKDKNGLEYTHTLEDTINNLYSILFDILDKEWDKDLRYEIYDFIDTSVKIEIEGVRIFIKEI